MRDLALIITDARRAAHAWTAPQLAGLLGCSVRTVHRNARTGGLVYAHDHHALIAAVHPNDPVLAAEYAAAVGTSLEALGLGRTPRSAAETTPEHADLVTYAAADVLDLPPKRVRQAVAAAFAKAQELRVPVEGLVPHLAAKGKAPRKRGP